MPVPIPYDPMQINSPGNGAEPTISWDEMIHPDMEAIAKRDAFLSDENGKKLTEAIDQIHLLEEIIGKYRKAKEGHWIVLDFCANEGIYCSECHMKIFDRTTKPKKKLAQYCPHCGSKNEQFFRDGKVVFR